MKAINYVKTRIKVAKYVKIQQEKSDSQTFAKYCENRVKFIKLNKIRNRIVKLLKDRETNQKIMYKWIKIFKITQ